MTPFARAALAEALTDARGETSVYSFAAATGLRLRAIAAAEDNPLRPISANVVAAYHAATGNHELIEILDRRSRHHVESVLVRRGAPVRFAEPRLALTRTVAAALGARVRHERETQRMAIEATVSPASRRRELEGFERGVVPRPTVSLLDEALQSLDLSASEMFWSAGIEAQSLRQLEPRRWFGTAVPAAVTKVLATAFATGGQEISDVAYLSRVPLAVVEHLDDPRLPLTARSAARLGVVLGLSHRDLSSGDPAVDSQVLAFHAGWRAHRDRRARQQTLDQDHAADGRGPQSSGVSRSGR
ncbi:MAG: hypothetical protein ACOYNI_07165 [Acidimicrobiia bacterium]